MQPGHAPLYGLQRPDVVGVAALRALRGGRMADRVRCFRARFLGGHQTDVTVCDWNKILSPALETIPMAPLARLTMLEYPDPGAVLPS